MHEVHDDTIPYRNGAESWSFNVKPGPRYGGEPSRAGRIQEPDGPKEYKKRFTMSAKGLINSKNQRLVISLTMRERCYRFFW